MSLPPSIGTTELTLPLAGPKVARSLTPSKEELALFLIGELPPNTLPYTPTPALGKAGWSQ